MGRLVEIWCAQTRKAGSGWAVGRSGVLTVGHVVAGAGADDHESIQIRSSAADTPDAWVNGRVCWSHPTLDIALIEITPAAQQRWAPPADASPSLVAVGARELRVEAVGFPGATARPDGLRRPEHIAGRLLPGRDARDREKRLMPLDVDTSVPADARLWKGFSGAAVFDDEGHLMGLVVEAEQDREQRRLLVLAVEHAFVEGFLEAARLVGFDAVLSDRLASVWRANAAVGSLSPSGSPRPANEVEDLGVFGVHRAFAGFAEHPYSSYVPRASDRALADALTEAASDSPRFVLVVGDSASGKSRSAAEVLRRHPLLGPRRVLVPSRDRGLPNLIDARIPLGGMTVWLDDLDKYVAQGLDHYLFHRLLDAAPGVVVLATIRRRLLQGEGSLSDPLWEFLTDDELVRQVDVESGLTPGELDDAHRSFSDASLLAALDRGFGLGEYLVGGRKLVKKLNLARGYNRHLVDTVVSWYRTGLQQPMRPEELRWLWAQTLSGDLASHLERRPDSEQDRQFRDACSWACAPVMERDAHVLALVNLWRDGYEPSDYVVDHVSRQLDRPSIAAPIWDAALKVADEQTDGKAERLSRIGMAAHAEGHHEHALTAMRASARLGNLDDWLNVGIVLGELGRFSEELQAYDTVSTLCAGSAAPAAPALLARSMVNRAWRLGEMGKLDQELALYDDVAARFATDADPEMRRIALRALSNKAHRFGQAARLDDEIAAYERMTESFGRDEVSAIRQLVARTMRERSSELIELEDFEHAIRICDFVHERFAGEDEWELRSYSIEALVNKSGALGFMGRLEEAVAVYDQVIGSPGIDSRPDILAGALVNKGVRLSQLDRVDPAIAMYDLAVARFGSSVGDAIEAQVARARSNKALALARVGRSADALHVYDELVERHSDATEPATREQVAIALLNKSAYQTELDRLDDAIEAANEVVVRFGSARELAMRKLVGNALGYVAAGLDRQQRFDDALAAYDELLIRFADTSEPELREYVAHALSLKALVLLRFGDAAQALDLYDDMLTRFGHDSHLDRYTGAALANQASVCLAQGRIEEALVAYERLFRRAAVSDAERELRASAAGKANEAADRLEDAGRVEEAVAIRSAVVDLCRSDDDLREYVVEALLRSALSQSQHGSPEDAVGTWDEVVGFLASGEAPRSTVAYARACRALMLDAVGRTEEALASYEDVLDHFAADLPPELRDQVLKAASELGADASGR